MGSGFRIHLENIIRRVLEDWLTKRDQNPKSHKSTGVPAHEVALQLQARFKEVQASSFLAGACYANGRQQSDEEIQQAAVEWLGYLEANAD